MPTYQRSSAVPATPAELFSFHGDPRNLRAVSPPGLRILAIDSGQTAVPGELFSVAVQQGPLVLRWQGNWETVEPPGRLVDVGVRSPFAFWRHEHRFDPAPDGGSLLTDRVEFRLPWYLGGPIGDWFVRHFVMPRLFAARHEATRRHFAAMRGEENTLAGGTLP